MVNYCYRGNLVNYGYMGNLCLNKLRKGFTMSSWLIIVTGLIYGYIAIEQGIKGNLPMAVVYSGYAFSNVGLYILATK